MLSYYLFLLPALILAGIATIFTQTTFSKYSRLRAASGMTGAQAAGHMLSSQGIYDVTIEPVQGFLTDHYDPTSKTLRLSPGVYSSDSLSAIGVACHEAGHALQHAAGYTPLYLRSAMVPVAQFGTFAPWLLFLLGMLFFPPLIKLAVLVFAVVVFFSLVTLPVEWNASARAKALMVSTGIVSHDEQEMAGRVLNAAFLTYVAAAFMALLEFIYFLLRSGLLGGRRNN